MVIIKKEKTGLFHEIQQQSHRAGNWLGDGWLEVPDGIEQGVLDSQGFCDLTIEDGILVAVSENPADREEWEAVSLDEQISKKIDEISASCNAAIVEGCDVVLSDEATYHFSLAETDQINLATAQSAVASGATSFPYHADGALCKLFSAADILLIAQAATAHKLYHTTYCNHLFVWIRRTEDAEDLAAITYGATLPDDLAANMAEVLSYVSGG